MSSASMEQFKYVELNTFDSPGYTLTPIELEDVVDFEVKRVYSIVSGQEGCVTGEHCHYEEKEFFWLVQGKATAVIDQGNGREDVVMTPQSGIYVANYVWHGFKELSDDAVIIALSSTNYSPDRSDYLEDYDEYMTFRDEKLGVNNND